MYNPGYLVCDAYKNSWCESNKYLSEYSSDIHMNSDKDQFNDEQLKKLTTVVDYYKSRINKKIISPNRDQNPR